MGWSKGRCWYCRADLDRIKEMGGFGLGQYDPRSVEWHTEGSGCVEPRYPSGHSMREPGFYIDIETGELIVTNGADK